MTIPAQHSGRFTPAELFRLSAHATSHADSAWLERLADDAQRLGFAHTRVVLDPAALHTFRRYPVQP